MRPRSHLPNQRLHLLMIVQEPSNLFRIHFKTSLKHSYATAQDIKEVAASDALARDGEHLLAIQVEHLFAQAFC